MIKRRINHLILLALGCTFEVCTYLLMMKQNAHETNLFVFAVLLDYFLVLCIIYCVCVQTDNDTNSLLFLWLAGCIILGHTV